MQKEQEQLDDRSATRLRNRALQTVSRNQRKRIARLEEHGDELFVALCNTGAAVVAENAFAELWGSALFDCGPEDYDYMVEKIKDKFKKFPEGAY